MRKERILENIDGSEMVSINISPTGEPLAISIDTLKAYITGKKPEIKKEIKKEKPAIKETIKETKETKKYKK